MNSSALLQYIDDHQERLFSQAGVESELCCPQDMPEVVSCGGGRDFNVPGGAHLPDEFMECDDLVAIAKALGEYILDWDEESC